MIRGIIFDCFGVLAHGSLDYLRSLTPPEHLRELNDLSRASDVGYISHDEYVERVSELIGCKPDEVDGITRSQRVRSDAMTNLVRSLRGRYKIGLLSNIGRGVINELFTPQELTELFDAVILSSEVGMVKPNSEVYELAASRLGLAPSDCIMIDDLVPNIAGAEFVGMRGILFSGAEQCEKELSEAIKEASHA